MEHHSPFCRSNEHRFLSMGNRRGQVAGRAVAGSFQGKYSFRVYPARGLFMMMLTNFIMNVAAIAVSLPVALVRAAYLMWRRK